MQTVAELQQHYENYLRENRFTQAPVELYEPANYILELGGKRLRPVMALMSYGLFHDEVAPALPLAHAVEMFHNFSLVHDDIMDQAPLRRGKPTVHHRYGVNTAILTGDVMLIYVYEFLLQIPRRERIPDLVKVFNRVAIEVCEGQQLDMNFENRMNVRIDEYIDMIGRKTAALVSGALEMGALAAGASLEDAQRLAAFGRHVGIAFQLQDDILDTFGESEKVGKKIGGDIAQNKKTYLVLKAMEIAEPAVRARLVDLLSSSPENETGKIVEVTAILKYLNIPELAEAEKQRHQQLAFDAFRALSVEEERKTALRRLAGELLGREY